MRTEPFAESELRRDAFLGGRLSLWQPTHGYRAGIDPVLLAASIPAHSGQRVLDLGCGSGVAVLCLGARVPGVALAGLEVQPGYADLARRNAAHNGIDLDVVTGDVAAVPSALRQRLFDHVIANPPYFDRDAGSPARDAGREQGLGEGVPLADWVAAAARRVAPKGFVTMIQRAERVPELMGEMSKALGSLELLPLTPRAGRAARLVLMRGRKGGRAAFRLHDGWCIHAGAAHACDGEDYTPATAAVLRDAAALPFSA
ncbi:tRNA1(Val) (adenine(37)-N6)-methyltransferase [Roseovarius sp. D22-M7]|uniref:tRNA1(Val) (adenine(37)-N6)-methyltransferase n=1 Tax=Roseovarius sp. D22-M7 TaxID=3127116 RepID=UPI00300FA58E